MGDKLLSAKTLSKGNPFLWTYDGKEILIFKKDKNDAAYTFAFTNTEVEGLIDYIKEKGRMPLGNSVSKVADGTEKDGIGKYIYNNIAKDTSLVQTASQLVSILHHAEVLHYNNKKKGMEFWISHSNWKEQLLRLVDMRAIKAYEEDLENGCVEIYDHNEVRKMLGL